MRNQEILQETQLEDHGHLELATLKRLSLLRLCSSTADHQLCPIATTTNNKRKSPHHSYYHDYSSHKLASNCCTSDHFPHRDTTGNDERSPPPPLLRTFSHPVNPIETAELLKYLSPVNDKSSSIDAPLPISSAYLPPDPQPIYRTISDPSPSCYQAVSSAARTLSRSPHHDQESPQAKRVKRESTPQADCKYTASSQDDFKKDDLYKRKTTSPSYSPHKLISDGYFSHTPTNSEISPPPPTLGRTFSEPMNPNIEAAEGLNGELFGLFAAKSAELFSTYPSSENSNINGGAIPLMPKESLSPVPPTLRRKISEPSSSCYHAITAGRTSSRPPGLDHENSNSMDDRYQNENGSEAVWVETNDDGRKGLIIHFKCACGKIYEILLFGNDCYYKLM